MSLRSQLEQVRKDYGRLTPRNVVDAARDPANPLHRRFEWDDSVAAERYRLAQARQLIQTVRCSFVSPTSGATSVRVFHSVPATGSAPAYEPLADIVADPVTEKVLEAEMRRDWKSFEARYRHLAEFNRLFGSVPVTTP
jgi:hypothetical protein